MKNLFILAIFLVNIASLLAQDNLHPTPLNFTYKSIFSGSDTTAPVSIKQFPQKEFVRGWQWSGNDKITEAMHSNMQQGKLFPKSSYTASKKINTIATIWGLPYFAVFHQFEPTLQINNPGSFEHRTNDKEHSIYGFGKILGEAIITDTNNVNFNRLKLKPSGSYKDSVILQNAWLMLPYRFDERNTSSFWDVNGQHYFLTVNLRRLNVASNYETDSVILSIRLPYRVAYGDTAVKYAKFCGLPDTNQVLRLEANGFRGHAYDTMLISPANRTTTFNITQNMLPKASDSMGIDITLSAYLNFDNQVLSSGNNPFFDSYGGGWDTNSIISTDIEVTYHGVDSIAIDYIRFENPAGQKLLRGEYDTAGTNSIKYWGQKILNHYDTMPNLRAFRFYGNDGDDGDLNFRWGAIQYANRLLGGLVTGSMGQKYGASGGYLMEGADRWTCHLNPAKTLNGALCIAAPFLRPRNQHINAMTSYFGYHNYGYNASSGYRGGEVYWDSVYNFNDTTPIMTYNPTTVRTDHDSLNSFYETYMTTWENPGAHAFPKTDDSVLARLRSASLETYLYALGLFSQAFQANWEPQIYENFMNPLQSSFLYYDQPWWSQLFIVSNWNAAKKNDSSSYRDILQTGSVRPPTGEETRLAAMTAITMGAKGIVIDRQSTYDSAPDSSTHASWGNFMAVGVTSDNDVRSDTSSLTGLAYLKSDWLGSDFLQPNEYSHIDQYVNRDTLAYWMQVKPTRVYLGRKSQRLELTKIWLCIKKYDAYNCMTKKLFEKYNFVNHFLYTFF